MRYLLCNGTIIDPDQRVATVGHVLIADGKIVQLFDLTDRLPESELLGEADVIDVRGCIIAPGLTDLHVHLREPGEEHKETIASGTQAAARGGFTAVCAMPNTRPAYDSVGTVRLVQQAAATAGRVRVDVIGAITMGREGRTLSEMAELVEAGCIAFSDDGSPVSDPAIMRNALAYARMLNVPIMSHCEDTRLNPGWAMHEGAISTRLGLPGYPAAAEEAHIARDIALAEQTGGHLHICHVSTAGGVALVRTAKQRGIRVTAEVTPHHLTLTDRWVLGNLGKQPEASRGSITGRLQAYAERQKRNRDDKAQLPLESWLNPTLLQPYDTSTRVSPPLRSEADLDALLAGLADDTIDAIATDHAPHAVVDKSSEYGLAACGISGLETALALVLTLVHRGAMDMLNAITKLTASPARILNRVPASLQAGAPADVVVFDPERQWMVNTAEFVSKGKNSPLHGQRLKGQVMLTMAGGAVLFRREGFGNNEPEPPIASKIDGILPLEEE